MNVDSIAISNELEDAFGAILGLLVPFNEHQQELFCRVCRYRDPLIQGSKLHAEDCSMLRLHNAVDKAIEELRAAQRTEGHQDVEIVVNGQPVSVAGGPIRAAIAAAIAKSGQIGAPIDQWVLRTREGDVIPHELPDGHEYALSGGQQFFLHLGLPPTERTEGRLTVQAGFVECAMCHQAKRIPTGTVCAQCLTPNAFEHVYTGTLIQPARLIAEQAKEEAERGKR